MSAWPNLWVFEPCRAKCASNTGELRRERAEAKAERIIAEELQRLAWTRADLELAARLSRVTASTIRELAQRLHLGSWKSATTRLHNLKRKENQRGTIAML